MKTLLRVAAPLALLLLAAAVVSPAQASCPLARSIGPFTTYIYTPGFPHPPNGGSTTPELKGSFWSFSTLGPANGGNPATGVGNDSGTIPQYNWLYWPGYDDGTNSFAAHLVGPGPDGNYDQSHWNAAGVDGCIDNDTASPGGRCMVALLTDDDDGGTGHFALLSVGPDAGQDYDFSAATGGGNIVLAPIPKTNITNSIRNGSLSVDLTINTQLPGGPANGLYLGCQAAALQGARYRVYVRDQADQSPAPGGSNSRDLGNWTAASGPHPIGASTSLNVACNGVDREFYLCSTVEFPTGNGQFYEVGNCSRNSTRVECGPNIAEPQQPRRPSTPKPGRLGQRGGR